MIRCYVAGAEGARPFPEDGVLPEGTVWVDVADPLPHEKEWVEKALALDLPTRADMEEIEASSRVYREGDASFMTATQVVGLDSDDPTAVPIAFILTPRLLVTLRFSDPHSFRQMILHCERVPLPDSSLAVLIKLLDMIVDRLADILERMSADVDRTSRQVFGRDTPKTKRLSSDNLRDILSQIGAIQFVVNKVHDSLLTFARMISFLNLPQETEAAANGSRAKLDKRSREGLKSLVRDVSSLLENSSYLTNNIAFLLDAALGRISIEQNAIIKIFSVAAVVFLPPTLVASIYGMNFEHMPELKLQLGYPMAILMMILSAVLPYLWFKKKGWL
ncbi:magnesium transporter CorA family protein [Sandaracinobacteroides saxicola]|uniref:Magnesium transport protein CorA n=1 Tax=Sandaracinobacteroides saxicola TaxID=2759707 RepID=A0A7G5IGC4_9SPHN|nr:magnesium transporter CorA family protein [Sandaracinobacteroides saxicola]QMW22416.1 magnesium transporter CorA family protein [Sandaracinobacteroides saxicola]